MRRRADTRGIKGGRNRRRETVRRRRRLAVLAGLFVILLLIIFGAGYYSLYRYVHKTPADVILDNIYIGSIDVSGMTGAEAKTALAEQIEKSGSETLQITVGDQAAECTLAELGLGLAEVDQYVKEAVGYGKKGAAWKRYRMIQKLKKRKKQIAVTYTVDKEGAAALLDERTEPLEVKAVDAVISRENGTFIITDEQQGEALDAEQTIEAIHSYLNGEWNLASGTVAGVLVVDAPRVRRTDLETIKDVLGSYYTAAGYGDRVNNLARGAELINGTIVMPGEEISIQQITSPYTEENGYYEATAYENGQVVPSIGGGICQVSTTMYNAALYSELEITQRAPHSMSVNYVEPSMDAAIAGDYKDLKFKNNYQTPIYLESYIDGNNNLVMTIYGQENREAGRELEFISETLSVTEAPDETKYVASSQQSVGYMKQTTNPYQGIEAQLIKRVTVNGEVVSEDVINSSSYRSASAVVTVGTASANPNASEVMQNAIETQDWTKIEEAITQAQGMENSQTEGSEDETR